MSLILAIDQGTSSSRGIVFDLAAGRILGEGHREFACRFPRDGWVEQDPEAVWSTTLSACRKAIDNAGATGSDIRAIGITNQRETTLVWDRRTGACVHDAIVWQDRRTADRCERLRSDGLENHVKASTGLVADPYFSATKLAWLLDSDPALRSRAAAGELCFGTIDTFLLWRLTGGRSHLTDATNASRTMLFDIRRQAWDEELLRYFDIPPEMLPEVRDSAAEFGVTDESWFGAPIPVTGIAGDQQAALVGQGCFAEGACKVTCGTGCFAVTNTGGRMLNSSSGLLSTVGYRIAGETTYALEGSVFVAGAAIKWLRDTLGIIASAAETESLARETGAHAHGVYVVPAFTGLGAPWWNPDARGTITGLTLDSTRGHIVTATLQSVAYQTAELLEAMAGDGAAVDRLRVDGGMAVNDWLCQFMADMLNVPVERPPFVETTALGAATLAGFGAGLTASLHERDWGLDRSFAPGMPRERRQALLDGWRNAVRQTLAGTQMRYAGFVESGDPQSSQRIDEIVYGGRE